MPRFGRVYHDVVLCPLAEQLITIAGVSQGDTVLDLLCDGGVLASQAANAVGASGRVLLVDDDDENLVAARSAVGSQAACATYGLQSLYADVADGACDRSLCLLTLGYGDPALLMSELTRVTRPGGVVAVMTFGDCLPLHEQILADAISEVEGRKTTWAASLLPTIPELFEAAAEQIAIRDVIRFDGAHQYWDAVVAHRNVALGKDARPIREKIDRALEPLSAADGTIYIPCDARVYRSVI